MYCSTFFTEQQNSGFSNNCEHCFTISNQICCLWSERGLMIQNGMRGRAVHTDVIISGGSGGEHLLDSPAGLAPLVLLLQAEARPTLLGVVDTFCETKQSCGDTKVHDEYQALNLFQKRLRHIVMHSTYKVLREMKDNQTIMIH